MMEKAFSIKWRQILKRIVNGKEKKKQWMKNCIDFMDGITVGISNLFCTLIFTTIAYLLLGMSMEESGVLDLKIFQVYHTDRKTPFFRYGDIRSTA